MSTVWGVSRHHQLHEQPWAWLLFELHFTDDTVEAQKGQELRNSLRAPARPARGRPPEGTGISEPAPREKARSRSKLCVVWAWVSVRKAGSAVLGKQSHVGKPQSLGRARCRPDCRAVCASASAWAAAPLRPGSWSGHTGLNSQARPSCLWGCCQSL